MDDIHFRASIFCRFLDSFENAKFLGDNFDAQQRCNRRGSLYVCKTLAG
jgi:hypothetical protein